MLRRVSGPAGDPGDVVEQNDIPGGYATSFDRASGKFTFEVSLHGISAKNNAVERILENLGVYNRLEFVELPEVYCLKTLEGEVRIPQRDPEKYIRDLAARCIRMRKRGSRDFVHEMIGIADEANLLHQRGGKFFKPIFPLQYRKMWKVRHKTLEEMLNEHVKNMALKDTLAGLWGYYGLPPSQLSAFYYSVATGGYLKNGSYYIKQRSQDLSNALAEAIETCRRKNHFRKTSLIKSW